MTHVVDRIEFGTDDGQKEYNEERNEKGVFCIERGCLIVVSFCF